jgi:hypothetical protein
VVEALGEEVNTDASVRVPKAVEVVLVEQLMVAATEAVTDTWDEVAALAYSGPLLREFGFNKSHPPRKNKRPAVKLIIAPILPLFIVS